MATKAAKKKPQATGDMSENDLPTEAELLRMPESDYMNERQLGFFRDRLRQLETQPGSFDLGLGADQTLRQR